MENVYILANSSERTIEQVIIDEFIHYNHIILPKGERLPEHYTNAKSVYMTVLNGTLTIALDDKEFKCYKKGTILKIPFNTKMNVLNESDELLELTVIKTPAP